MQPSLTVALFSLLAPGMTMASEPIRLFILAGQSNATGRAFVSDGIPGRDPADGAVRYCYNTDAAGSGKPPVASAPFATLCPLAGRFGPEIGIGRTLQGVFPGHVALVKYSRGATSLAEDWNVADPVGSVLYRGLLQLIGSATVALDAEETPYEIAGVFWVQGESDMATSRDYARNLCTLVATLRRDLGLPRLPFVIAQTGENGTAAREKVRRAQAEFCAADPYAALVNLDDLGRSDGVHYDAPSTVLAGQRLGSAYVRLSMLASLRIDPGADECVATYVRPVRWRESIRLEFSPDLREWDGIRAKEQTTRRETFTESVRLFARTKESAGFWRGRIER